MKKTDIKKAEKLGQLLAESPMSDEIKSEIIDNIDKIPMDLVDKLTHALQNEHKLVDKLVKEIEEFSKTREKDWSDLEKRQQAAVDKIVSQEEEKIKKEIMAQNS